MRFPTLLCTSLSTFAVLILSVSLHAQASVGARGQNSNESTTDIVVPGDSGPKWVNTGITVAAGNIVRLDATGQVDVGGSWGVHGPEGTTQFFEQPPGYYPLDTKRRYGLAGRITLGPGQKHKPTQTWIYGESKEIKVTRSGILWLTVNDDEPDGNTGEFRVKIIVVKKK
ncbi:MAG TPA: hypothetical protein VJL58_09665 [Pyrinomonadaceae bacterium]|nr:hypothetical protein [Pyrinomonadaceae bacterium]